MTTEEKKKVVLLVDDTPENIQIVNAILKDTYRIRIATNGAKALDLARTDPMPDLILLDVMMPEMDGFEVCLRLKLDATTRDIPVIFLTGATEVADETRGFEVGGVDYIHKPFSQAVVRARVHNHLMLREARDQIARQLASIRTELETARQIQLSILPREAPALPGIDIAAHYSPMTSVAGDFYDFIKVDDHRFGTLVADVSGHGMPAALISSMLKIAFAEQADSAADPAHLLSGLNQTLCGKFKGHFVTAAYVFIDTEKKMLRYGGAGHPPMLLRSHANGARELVENGLFLGSFPFAQYSAIELPFEQGDWVLLYTDGVLEMNNAKEEEFGIDRLKLFLELNGNQPSSKLVDAALAELAQWSAGREAEDDLTLLAIHFNPA
ncbi:MAG: SpoIIE family protein phosphatase [Silvibacterium sp.]|nr:SpoIIE family protein phosphatase [Silvibacterium sp.]MBV8632470.1 SpoIIE family protein phosphatase [Silvibacterium sp.]